MSVEEAWGVAPHRPPSEARRSLDQAMADFRETVGGVRSKSALGAPMPAAAVQAWSKVLDAVESQVSRKQARWTPIDLARTRVELEAEADADRATFADTPPALALRISAALKSLSLKLTALTTQRRAADPARFHWPVEPVVMTSPFGYRVHPVHGGHRLHQGIDLLAELAQPVRAVEAGAVVFSDWNGAYGNEVEVQHDAHVSTRYAHLEVVLAPTGKYVRKGDIIGLAGQTGLATGPHLHFEIRRDGEALDPEALMPAPRVGVPPKLISRAAPSSSY